MSISGIRRRPQEEKRLCRGLRLQYAQHRDSGGDGDSVLIHELSGDFRGGPGARENSRFGVKDARHGRTQELDGQGPRHRGFIPFEAGNQGGAGRRVEHRGQESAPNQKPVARPARSASRRSSTPPICASQRSIQARDVVS